MLVLYFGSGACCLSSTTLCHNSGMRMGKCMLIGVIHMFNYWTSTGSVIMFSHWWVIFEVWVMFWSYSGLHASYCLWTQEWGFVQSEEKVSLMVNGVDKGSSFFFYLSYFLLPILNNIDLNVCLKDVHVIYEMLPTVLVFTVSMCQVIKQFSSLGLTQKSNLQQVTSFLISVHVTAV